MIPIQRADRAARRGLLAALTATLASAALLASASPASALTLCTWGGTPLKATGSFTTSPGLAFRPQTTVSKFFATGRLGGLSSRCRGTMTWRGVATVTGGSPLTAKVSFQGEVEGLAGVARFGPNAVPGLTAPLSAPSQLYDASGKAVGIESANVFPSNLNLRDFLAPFTSQGLEGGPFSSVFLLY